MAPSVWRNVLMFEPSETIPPSTSAIEASSVILKALAGGTLSFKGEHFRFDEVPIEMAPVQKPHPPLWCGTSNPEGTRWFAEHERSDLTAVGIAPDLGERYLETIYQREWIREVYGEETVDPVRLTVGSPA